MPTVAIVQGRRNLDFGREASFVGWMVGWLDIVVRGRGLWAGCVVVVLGVRWWEG